MKLGEITELMKTLDNWHLERESIVKEFEFDNFEESLNFVNKVGKVSEENAHHPDILIKYNKVKLSITTHSSNGLTEKDFDLAKKIDKLE